VYLPSGAGVVVDPVSLTIALAAVAVSVFIYFETRRQRKLTEVMVRSLAFLEKTSKRRNSPERKPKLDPRPVVSPDALSPQEQQRLDLARRNEERKALELQLCQQREQWKRQRDIAKAIGWVLDRIGSDEEYDED
jgi:hypothetical protein